MASTRGCCGARKWGAGCWLSWLVDGKGRGRDSHDGGVNKKGRGRGWGPACLERRACSGGHTHKGGRLWTRRGGAFGLWVPRVHLG